MLPSLHYRQLIAQGYIESDEQQLGVLIRLDALYAQLTAAVSWPQQCRRLVRQWLGRDRPPQGVYVWGGVGTGKSFLMDNFFKCLPFPDKLRLHFHNFMRIKVLPILWTTSPKILRGARGFYALMN
jgi:cell division protein ZapE